MQNKNFSKATMENSNDLDASSNRNTCNMQFYDHTIQLSEEQGVLMKGGVT